MKYLIERLVDYIRGKYDNWNKDESCLNCSHDEYQYLDLVRDILDNGTLEKGRNGDTLVKFGAMMKYDLKNDILPVLTTKKVAIKTCINELFWFINGSTSNAELKAKNVNIWNGNSTREFLD